MSEFREGMRVALKKGVFEMMALREATIDTISGSAMLIVFDRPFSFLHSGKHTSTSAAYGNRCWWLSEDDITPLTEKIVGRGKAEVTLDGF
jgi:hypothetical protein